ncbi:ribonuclease H-like domain-containing protein, partial [Tanacetum coccineum]
TGTDTAYLLLYVDDIVLTASSENLLQQIISSLHQEFAMTDLGPLNYFLGIFVTRDSSGLFLSQKKYVVEILDKAHMANCNPSRTPIDTESKLGSDRESVSDPTLYRSLAEFSSRCFLVPVQRQNIVGLPMMLLKLVGYAIYCHQCTKHIEIDIHFVCDLVAAGQVRMLHVPSRYQFADIFTKCLHSALFEEFRSSLSVCCPPAPTAGEC